MLRLLTSVLVTITTSLLTTNVVTAQALRPLFGVVVNQDGEPLAGAKVHCALPNLADLRHRTATYNIATTDARGRFRINVHPCTYHLVWAIGPAGKSGQSACSELTWTTSSSILELRADKLQSRCKLTVKGLEKWLELAPFRVRIHPNDTEIPDQEFAIKDDGTCTLPVLPTGRLSIELLDKNDEPLYAEANSSIRSAKILRVPPPKEVPMLAVNENGKPLEGVIIRQILRHTYAGKRRFGTRPPPSIRRRRIGKTDANGRLVASVAYSGTPFAPNEHRRITFEAELPGIATTHSGFDDGTFVDGRQATEEDIKELQFTLPATPPIAGQLSLGPNRGLANQTILVRLKTRIELDQNSYSTLNLYRSIKVDKDGRFELPRHHCKVDSVDFLLDGQNLRSTLIPADLHRRTAYQGVCLHKHKNLADQELRIDLSELHTLDLQFLNKTGGPANNIDIIVLSRKQDGSHDCDSLTPMASTDRAGRLSLLLERGKWLIFARNQDQMTRLNIDIESNETHELRLQPMPLMTGKVVDENDKPAENASLNWFGSSTRGEIHKDNGLCSIANALNTGWMDATRTDANGYFRCAFLHFPNRTYRARFSLGNKSSSGFLVQPNKAPNTIVIKSK